MKTPRKSAATLLATVTLAAVIAGPAQAQAASPAAGVESMNGITCNWTTTDGLPAIQTTPNGQDACIIFGDAVEDTRFAEGQFVKATFPNGLSSELIMQTDGNLVLRLSNGVTWGSETRTRGVRAVLQTDGNFVVYDASNKGIWDTNTRNSDGTKLAIQSDGNLVAYDERTGGVLWHAF